MKSEAELWTRVHAALDEGRDPLADAAVEAAIVAHPEDLQDLLALLERLEPLSRTRLRSDLRREPTELCVAEAAIVANPAGLQRTLVLLERAERLRAKGLPTPSRRVAAVAAVGIAALVGLCWFALRSTPEPARPTASALRVIRCEWELSSSTSDSDRTLVLSDLVLTTRTEYRSPAPGGTTWTLESTRARLP